MAWGAHSSPKQKMARARHYDAGRFSFNVAKGRCPTCKGEGFVCVELLLLPSVYAPCQTCQGTRYNPKTLEIQFRGKSIADVPALTVDAAWEFFAGEQQLRRSIEVLLESASAICDWGNLPPNSLAARRSVSNWQPSYSESSEEQHFTFSMSRRPASTPPMWTS